jgi:spermidine synthase
VLIKHKPHQLALPHQYAMMLPLLLFKPEKILMFGLGGGDFLRFIAYHHHNNSQLSKLKPLQCKVIEYQQAVVDCFWQYFHCYSDFLTANNLAIENSEAGNYIAEHSTEQIDWCIYDIFTLSNTWRVKNGLFE